MMIKAHLYQGFLLSVQTAVFHISQEFPHFNMAMKYEFIFSIPQTKSSNREEFKY